MSPERKPIFEAVDRPVMTPALAVALAKLIREIRDQRERNASEAA